MMQPTMEGVNQVAAAAAAGWQHVGCAPKRTTQSSTRLIEQHAFELRQTIEARVKGKISDEDFVTMKAAIAAEVAAIETGTEEAGRRNDLECRNSSKH